ncbi:MAG: hypothetical protein GY898_26565 [Proteobacteria bacterium]|nr:hypothetical protein [Pseudomonadota bacterium]
MTQSAASTASEMTRVSKVRVQILADSFIYEGYVYLLAETRRIQEVLNDPKPFLNLTEVVIHDRASATTHHAPYAALNKGAITHVVVLSGDGTGLSMEDSSSDATASAGGQGAVAAQMTVPPAGPRTVPIAPPPAKKADPPTQPFPRARVTASSVRDDDDVSDLILDDDGGDDIDPDDLERDVGALIAGAD